MRLLWFQHDFHILFAGGAGGTDETGTNKDTHQLPVISMRTLIDVPASLSCQFCDGTWKTQEPPCRFIEMFNLLHRCRNLVLFGYLQLVSCIRTFFRARA